jgi:hypothetical protein
MMVIPLLFVSASLLELNPVAWDHLSFFNMLAGGPRQGFRLADQLDYPVSLSALDANYEWGQHLWQLRQSMDRLNIKQVYMRPGTFQDYQDELGLLNISAFPDADYEAPFFGEPRYLYLAAGEWLKMPWCAERQPLAEVGFSGRIYKVGEDE